MPKFTCVQNIPFIISWKLHYFLIIKNTISIGGALTLRKKSSIYLHHLDCRQFQAFYDILYGLNSGSKLDRIKQSSRIFMDASQFFSCSTKNSQIHSWWRWLTLWLTLFSLGPKVKILHSVRKSLKKSQFHNIASVL